MNAPFPPGSLIAAYLRDSGGEEQDLSVLEQENEIRKWCTTNNLYVVSRVQRRGPSGQHRLSRGGKGRIS
jgi:hypothetical protein